MTLRLQASEPQVGLILAFLIILSLIAVILVIVALYRKHGSAVYYTQEDKEYGLSSEKIYTGGGGGPHGTSHVNWTHPSSSERMVSLTSTGYTVSRQNTAVFSPQSSLEQGMAGPGGPQNPNSSESHGGACSTCETAVKQVITSLPALEEAITASINGTSQSSKLPNGTFKIQGTPISGGVSGNGKPRPPSRQAHVKLPPTERLHEEVTETPSLLPEEEKPKRTSVTLDKSVGVQTSVEVAEEEVSKTKEVKEEELVSVSVRKSPMSPKKKRRAGSHGPKDSGTTESGSNGSSSGGVAVASELDPEDIHIFI